MELFRKNKCTSIWTSFENKEGNYFEGGGENNTAKGHAWEPLKSGEEKVLCNIKGPGIVRRIWFTLSDRSELALKNVFIRMYWDKSTKAAVDVPIGDFFCMGHGKMFAFENEFFTSPEGRSFVCTIPMPFKKCAKIVLCNETGRDISHLYFDVNLTIGDEVEDCLYFHSKHTLSNRLPLGNDPVILPEVIGNGCFLGSHITVCINPLYKGSWWGEGEVKFYIDYEDEKQLPSLVGSGTEDYISSAWEQSVFINRYSGCTILEEDRVAFYRLHVKDPIFFKKCMRANIQSIGGASRETVEGYIFKGIPCEAVSVDYRGEFSGIYKTNKKLSEFPLDSGVNFYRQDDFIVTAYYYLDTPY